MELIPTTLCKINWKGRPSWLYSDGTILPVIAGGDGSTDDGNNGDGTDGSNGSSDDDSNPKFTQKDLNRLLAREKSDGKRVATAEVLQALGVQNMDEAKDMIQKLREAEQAQLSDAEKAKNAAELAKAEADKAKADAALERKLARIERALIRAGASEEHIDRVSRLVDVEDDADQDKINEAVEALKEDMPALFEAPGETNGRAPDPKPPGSNPGRPPRTAGQGTPTPVEAAKAVLAARHPGKVKTP